MKFKFIVTGNTEEESDNQNLRRIQKSKDLALALWDLNQEFYNGENISADRFNASLSRYNINLEELVS